MTQIVTQSHVSSAEWGRYWRYRKDLWPEGPNISL